jgi:hypothetical protein
MLLYKNSPLLLVTMLSKQLKYCTFFGGTSAIKICVADDCLEILNPLVWFFSNNHFQSTASYTFNYAVTMPAIHKYMTTVVALHGLQFKQCSFLDCLTKGVAIYGNVGNYSLNYTAAHPRGLESSNFQCLH